MFFGGQFIAAGGFGVKQIDMTVFHSDDKVHVEQAFVLVLTVWDGKVLFSLVAVFIPPVYPLGVGFEKLDELLLGLVGVVQLDEWRERMAGRFFQVVRLTVVDAFFWYFPDVFFPFAESSGVHLFQLTLLGIQLQGFVEQVV